MKKIIMLLCFAANVSLVASNWKVLESVTEAMNYAYNQVQSALMPTNENNSLMSDAYNNCVDVKQNVNFINRDKVYATFTAFLNVGYQKGLEAANAAGKPQELKVSTLKDAIMNSSKIQKFGYVFFVGFTVYGVVNFAHLIKNKLSANKDDK